MSKIDVMVNEALAIARDNSHGYSQYNRWGPDYDCSSLMYHCARKAGYNVPNSGTRYTGTMIQHFMSAGFRCDAFDGNLNDLERGDILLNTQYHTAMYIGNGQIVEASIDERGGIAGATKGDQTGKEIHIRSVYNYPWTHVLTPPKESASTTSNTQSASTSKEQTTVKDYGIFVNQALNTIAIAVIAGKFGNGAARKENIYKAVQERVNKKMK